MRQPAAHQGGAVETTTPLELQQLIVAELRSEVTGGFGPAAAVQGLRIEQQSIQIEQAGCGKSWHAIRELGRFQSNAPWFHPLSDGLIRVVERSIDSSLPLQQQSLARLL